MNKYEAVSKNQSQITHLIVRLATGRLDAALVSDRTVERTAVLRSRTIREASVHGGAGGAVRSDAEGTVGQERLATLDELWLDGRRVDAFVVEELLHLLRDLHVLGQVPAADVRRRDDPIARQLPHVELVHGQHAVHALQEAALDRVDLKGEANRRSSNAMPSRFVVPRPLT